MRWLSDVKVCFFTCSFPTDQKVKCTLNLLRRGVKDWWEFVAQGFSQAKRVAMAWEQFMDMFRVKCIPLVEWEQLAQEYLDLRQTTESVTKITKMSTERIFVLSPLL